MSMSNNPSNTDAPERSSTMTTNSTTHNSPIASARDTHTATTLDWPARRSAEQMQNMQAMLTSRKYVHPFPPEPVYRTPAFLNYRNQVANFIDPTHGYSVGKDVDHFPVEIAACFNEGLTPTETARRLSDLAVDFRYNGVCSLTNEPADETINYSELFGVALVVGRLDSGVTELFILVEPLHPDFVYFHGDLCRRTAARESVLDIVRQHIDPASTTGGIDEDDPFTLTTSPDSTLGRIATALNSAGWETAFRDADWDSGE